MEILNTTDAIILVSYPFGEGHLMVRYLSCTGVGHCVAYRARSPRSRLRGHLRLLNRVHLSLKSKKSSPIPTLTEIDSMTCNIRTYLNPEFVNWGTFASELIMKTVMENQPAEREFYTLSSYLHALEAHKEPNISSMTRRFELALFQAQGFLGPWNRCINGHHPIVDGKLFGTQRAGFWICGTHGSPRYDLVLDNIVPWLEGTMSFPETPSQLHTLNKMFSWIERMVIPGTLKSLEIAQMCSK